MDLLNWLIHNTAPPGNNLNMLAYIPGVMLECCSGRSCQWFGSALHQFLKLFVGFLVTGRATVDKYIFMHRYAHTHTLYACYIEYGIFVGANFVCIQVSWGCL